MEATGELGKKIVPPRIEDAGLEDCALPPDAIREAFLRAASAVKSRAASIFSDGDCVADPWPEDRSDVVLGAEPEHGDPGPCAAEKGGGAAEEGAEDVVAPGFGGAEDKVVDGSEVKEGEGEEACVDGIRGLGIEEEGESDGGEEESEGERPRPILAEGYV